MPPTKIVIYQESKDNVPLNDWLATLPDAVRVRCDAKMEQLAELQREPTDDAVTIIHRRYIEGNPELEAYLIEERERLLLAGRIYDLRVNAGMSHAELAKKIGVPTSTIVRLEDTDYDRHSLPLLRKIAAFGMRLELNIVPMTKKEVRTTPPLKPHDQS